MNLIYFGSSECVICGSETEDLCICNRCFNKVYYCKEPFVIDLHGIEIYCYSACYYSGVMKELVTLLKFYSSFNVIEVIQIYCINTIKNFGLEFDLITFVPATKESRKKRGFNQSELLAKAISKKLGIKATSLLERIDIKKDQIGLGKAERWENIKKSFAIKENMDFEIVKNKRVIIIDDVITTGATSFYCAEKLFEMGASEVIVLTAARGRL
ncbi:ComF family protein [Clostridium sp. DL1XJH146]